MNTQDNGSKLYLYSIVCVAVLGGLLFGYDTAVISGAEKGLQAFFLGAPDFVYTDMIHGLTSSSALIGCILGSAISGLLASRLGRKKSLAIAGVLFFLSALGSYNPEFFFFDYGQPSLSLLVAFNVYRIIGGIGVGLASAICPMYIAEVAPSNIRGTLVSWNQFAIIFGQLVVYFVNFLILGDHTNPVIERIGETLYAVHPSSDPWTIQTGWRYMFGSEGFVALAFTILVCFVPESPRYLALTGKDTKALYVLTKINGSKAKEILHEIKNTVTVKSERLFSFGVMVIFVGVMLSVFQQAVGINAVLYYAPRIFDSMGMGNPMVQTVIMGVVNILFTLVAVFTVEKLGRKPLLIWGSFGMAIGAFGVAISNIVEVHPLMPVISIMVYSAAFMFSWGPICWVLISEIFPNTIRSAAVAIAVAFQWIFNFIVSSTFVPMYNMRAGDMGESFGHVFVYALYGAICILAAWFVYALVPETKGKTLEEMSALWRNREKKHHKIR
ncbi:D-xylose transporter XylE [Lepagella muris]|jgi:SP family xylose:H+ symportor-like MFS transporter|uniref:D-xylose transporter XylE n=1 Tax=Lepagella muris TaxID=3032870 RepID=A0AC61RG38_9BACT|nr:D-xylose transporter XylE [Lepagella muris]ROT07696.1 D-xylose transporter XylE [Muribaculaceae bacterium Isolate-037 (Harlan)]TGY78856.1 D-xylose transporter XylE [Lepagella muris]THG52296.1 D-xylose transporter XylE [Bacteroidales bacterium]TKC57969.1 D-xylose transporter XylE [Bacteroidales bacterium]